MIDPRVGCNWHINVLEEREKKNYRKERGFHSLGGNTTLVEGEKWELLPPKKIGEKNNNQYQYYIIKNWCLVIKHSKSIY